MPNDLLGVLVAAGRGRRMGGKKQFHPWPTAEGEKPLVAAAYDAVCEVCDSMIVVLGHEADDVAKLLRPRSIERVESDPDAPMFESVRAGLRAAQRIDAQATILLQPGDHPEVAAKTLAMLIAAGKGGGRAVMPEYQGRGGHPVLIPPEIARRLLSVDCPQGLRQFWADHPELCHRVAVDDPSVVRDIDTPPNK